MIRRILNSSNQFRKYSQLTRKAAEITKSEQQFTPVLSVDQEQDKKDLIRLSNEYTQELRAGNRLYFVPWVNDKKLIFESDIPHFHVWRYYLLGGVTGVLFLYMLYQGDSKYKYIITVPALSAFFFLTAYRHNLRNSCAYLSQITLNKNGKAADFVIRKKGLYINQNNVPLSQFILTKNDPWSNSEINQAWQRRLKSNNSTMVASISVMRKFGFIGSEMIAKLEEQHVLIPNNYVGNKFALEKVFNGEQVDTETI